MRHQEQAETFLQEPRETRSYRRGRIGKRVFWRDILSDSRLYGRSRWLHAPDAEEAEKPPPGGED